MKNGIFLLLFLPLAFCCQQQVYAQNGVITTIAGNGMNGFAGDSSAATACEFDFPGGVAVDSSGNVYIADEDNKRIRYIDPSGVVYTFLGGAGYFSDPKSVTVNSGYVYVADRGHNRVYKIDIATRVIISIAGTGAGGYNGDGLLPIHTELFSPYDVAIDNGGNIFIADADNNRVREIVKATGLMTTLAGNGIAGYGGDGAVATAASLNYPTGVAVDGAGDVYIADNNNHRIRMVNSAGEINTIAGNGLAGYSGDGGPATTAQLYNPNGVAVDRGGNLYIADENNHRVREVISGTQNIITVAGEGIAGFSGDGGNAIDASLYFPARVAVDAGGSLYIADENNNRIRKVVNTTGLQHINADNRINIYPDPASNELTIKMDKPAHGSYTLTNSMGTTIANGELTAPETVIDVTALPPGVYYIAFNNRHQAALSEPVFSVTRFVKM